MNFEVRRNEAICCLIGVGIGIGCCLMYRWLRNTFYGLDYVRTAGKICASPPPTTSSSSRLYTACSSTGSSSTLRANTAAITSSRPSSWSATNYATQSSLSSTLNDDLNCNESSAFSNHNSNQTSTRNRGKQKQRGSTAASTEFARARANRKLINSAATAATSPTKKLPVINNNSNNSNSTSSGCSSRAYSEQKEFVFNRGIDNEDDFYDDEYMYDEDTVTSINNYMKNRSSSSMRQQRLTQHDDSDHFEGASNSNRMQAQLICDNLVRMFNRHFYRNYKMKPKYMRSRYNRRSFLMNMATVASHSLNQHRQFERMKPTTQYTGNNKLISRNLFIERAITEANSTCSTTFMNDDESHNHPSHVLLIEATVPATEKQQPAINFVRSRSASFNNDLFADFNNNNLSSSRNKAPRSHASNSSGINRNNTNKNNSISGQRNGDSSNCLSANRSNKSNASTSGNSNLFLDEGDMLLFDSYNPSCSNSVCDLNGN